MSFTMTSGQRKFALTAHVSFSVGLLGAIAAFLALALAGLLEHDMQTVRAAYLSMNLIAWFVIVPCACGALMTGLIQSLGTPWGLFKHKWVVAKLALTVFATAVLLIKMTLIGQAARLAAEPVISLVDLRAAGLQLAVHAAGGLMLLLVPAVLSVYKPKGLTSYGRRDQGGHLAPTQEHHMGSRRPTANSGNGSGRTGTRPVFTVTLRRDQWLRVVGIVLAAHIAILHLAGVIGHGGH